MSKNNQSYNQSDSGNNLRQDEADVHVVSNFKMCLRRHTKVSNY